MGRSVMTHQRAEETMFFVLPDIEDLRKDQLASAQGDPEEQEYIAELPDEAYYDDLRWMFQDLLANTRSALRGKYPSFYDAERWDDELHLISENSLTEVWVAEYCGLVSVSIVPKNQCGYCWRPCDCDPIHNLATHWTRRMADRLAETIRENNYLEEYSFMARFSNGEAVYTKRAA